MTRDTSMALFRTVSSNETVPSMTGAGVTLRPPHSGDFAEWAALREMSRRFLVPWEPIWPADDLTRGAFRRRLKRYVEDQRSDLAYAFLIFRSDDNAMVGGLTIANIRRGVAQAGSVGYWVGAPFARKGYMTAAVRALIPYSFSALRLHRLEAACIPDNVASIRLLEKTGFKREGYARGYLCINGIWQDHLLFARLKDDVD
jgi:ribosomal-protein-alanine N-acetyltransferase